MNPLKPVTVDPMPIETDPANRLFKVWRGLDQVGLISIPSDRDQEPVIRLILEKMGYYSQTAKGPPMKPQPPNHTYLARQVIEAGNVLSDAIEEAVSAGLRVSGTFYDNDGEGLHVHDLTGEINIAVTKNEILAETD